MNLPDFEPLSKATQDFDFKAVYGEWVENGKKKVLPIAKVAFDVDKPQKCPFQRLRFFKKPRVKSRPLGFLEVSDKKVKFVPIRQRKNLLIAFVLGVLVAIILMAKFANDRSKKEKRPSLW